MTQKKKYSGVVIPAVTPLTAGFKLDHAAVETMFANFYKHQVSPFILGTTGESVSLPNQLKLDYLQAASRYQ
jgi:dihydrodipicolinate synthase/N-acetylneuraminate lyase